MIRKIISALFLICVGAALAHFGLSHHIVNTEQGHIFVPTDGMAWSSTYVDIRDWEREDFEGHPDVTTALLEHGHEDLVPVSTSDRLKRWFQEKAREVLE